MVIEFQVQCLIGKGGFGAVYEVKRLTDNSLLAMKCELENNTKQVMGNKCRENSTT